MDYSNWYTVDNVAKVFLASINRRDTRAFRVSCTLKEPVDPEILQQALDMAVEERPQFQVFIRRGVFWHYMEHTDEQPKVTEEHRRPCPIMYGYEKRSKLHYRVTYFGRRINLDMFHALTDGNGGFEFLNIIVGNYLQIKYPGKLDEITTHKAASADELAEDSFKQFYGKSKGMAMGPTNKVKKVYHIHGMLLPYDQLQFFEVHMPVDEILKRSKAAEVSLSSYIGAKLMMAIYQDMPALSRSKPIAISMPVNLRKFFPSETARNFFNSVTITHVFEGGETVETLAKMFDEQLKSELDPEKIAVRMDNYEKIEQLMFVRLVPLFIKNPVVASGAKKQKNTITATVSNLGKIDVPQEMKPYIEGYSSFCSTSTLFMTLGTYENDLTMGIASAYNNTSMLRRFLQGFSSEGIDVTVYATEVTR